MSNRKGIVVERKLFDLFEFVVCVELSKIKSEVHLARMNNRLAIDQVVFRESGLPVVVEESDRPVVKRRLHVTVAEKYRIAFFDRCLRSKVNVQHGLLVI